MYRCWVPVCQRAMFISSDATPKSAVKLYYLVILLLVVTVVSSNKLVIRVCNGPSCIKACNVASIAKTIEKTGGGVEVGFTKCMSWCKYSANVKLVPDGIAASRAAAGIAVQGMSALETQKKCFFNVNTEADAKRVGAAIKNHKPAPA